MLMLEVPAIKNEKIGDGLCIALLYGKHMEFETI